MQTMLSRTFLTVFLSLCVLPSWATPQINCDVIPNKIAKLTCQKNQAKIQQMDREYAQKKQAVAAKKAEEATYQGRKLYSKNSRGSGHKTNRSGQGEPGRQHKSQNKAKRYKKNSHAARMHGKRVARREAQAKRKEGQQQRTAIIAAQAAKKVEDAKKSKPGVARQQADMVNKNMVQSFKTNKDTRGDDGVNVASDYQDLSGLQVSSDEGDGAQPNSFWSYY